MTAQRLRFDGPTLGELMLARWEAQGWRRAHDGLTRTQAEARIAKLNKSDYRLSYRDGGSVWCVWTREVK